jgi:hypothetical protein
MHGFAIVNVGFAITAILATVAAYLATHPRTAAEPAITIPVLLAPAGGAVEKPLASHA